VWKTGNDCRFPGIHYVVFPGNVGDDAALSRVARKMGVSEKDDRSTSFSSVTVDTSTGRTFSDTKKTDLKADKLQMLDTLRNAQKQGIAVAAFNLYNLEGAKAVISAAEHFRVPVILQV